MNSDLVPVQFGSLSSNVYYERENQFRRDSVRIATTGGVTRPQLSSDLWGGQSTPESKMTSCVSLQSYAGHTAYFLRVAGSADEPVSTR